MYANFDNFWRIMKNASLSQLSRENYKKTSKKEKSDKTWNVQYVFISVLKACVAQVGCVAQWKTVGYSPANFPVLRLTCS